MWRHRKPLDSIEKTIVRSGYIFVEGVTNSFTFGSAENNPFKLNLFLPMFHFFKVHKEHPLSVTSCSSNHVRVYSAKRGEKRLSGQLALDKRAWDVTTFMLLPHSVAQNDVAAWKKFDLDDSFRATGAELKPKGPASLLYVAGQIDLSSSDGIQRYGFIPASQIQSQLFYWLRQGHLIGGYEKPLGRQQDVGRLEIPLGAARVVTRTLTRELENNYRCKIFFED